MIYVSTKHFDVAFKLRLSIEKNININNIEDKYKDRRLSNIFILNI